MVDVDFEVQAGEIVGLIGKRGSGSTSVLRALLALIPSTGQREVLGCRYEDLADPAARVSSVLDFAASPGWSARDFLRVKAAQAGLATDRLALALEEGGLADRPRARMRSLSVAARQRLTLASVLLGQPDLIILKDPATGLDPDGFRWLTGLLADLAASGVAVLVTCHPLSPVADEVHRVVAMEEGRVIVDATPDELVDRAGSELLVRTPAAEVVAERLTEVGATSSVDGNELRTRDVTLAALTKIAADEGAHFSEVELIRPSLPEALEDEQARGAKTEHFNGAVATLDPGPDVHGPSCAELETTLDEDLQGLERSPSRARVVALAGLGNGQGTTTLAAVISAVLAEHSRHGIVALSLANDGGRLSAGVTPDRRSSLDVVDLAKDAASAGKRWSADPYFSEMAHGARFVAGTTEPERLAELDSDLVTALLRAMTADHEMVLLDLGGELPLGALRAALTAADTVIVVATEAAAGAAHDCPLLGTIESEHGKAACVVVNKTDADRARRHAELRERYAAALPQDPDLARALDGPAFSVADLQPEARVAVKHLALIVARSDA